MTNVAKKISLNYVAARSTKQWIPRFGCQRERQAVILKNEAVVSHRLLLLFANRGEWSHGGRGDGADVRIDRKPMVACSFKLARPRTISAFLFWATASAKKKQWHTKNRYPSVSCFFLLAYLFRLFQAKHMRRPISTKPRVPKDAYAAIDSYPSDLLE